MCLIFFFIGLIVAIQSTKTHTNNFTDYFGLVILLVCWWLFRIFLCSSDDDDGKKTRREKWNEYIHQLYLNKVFHAWNRRMRKIYVVLRVTSINNVCNVQSSILIWLIEKWYFNSQALSSAGKWFSEIMYISHRILSRQ